MLPDFKLISHTLCPYVQRSVITLEEKQIPYQRINIDLAKPPPWFSCVSPMGKVPVLIVNAHDVLFESAVISEYLNEITGGSLHPSDLLQKAQHRAWIEFASQILNNIARLYNADNETHFTQERDTLIERLKQLVLHHSGDDYFSGANFYLIDAVYASVFRYFEVFDKYIDLGFFYGLDRLKHWQTNLANRASVKYAVTDNYGEDLISFIKSRQGHLAKLIERKTPL